jgi:hypothetical protein
VLELGGGEAVERALQLTREDFRIGTKPWARTAARRLLMVASVSPNSWRRSLWPRITYLAPAFFSNEAEASPVKAPFSSQ